MKKLIFFSFFSLLLLANKTVAGQQIALKKDKLQNAVHFISDTVFKKQNAVKIINLSRENVVAILTNSNFKNGIIEIDVAAHPYLQLDSTYRGFIGLAFRVQKKDSLQYESFYIRTTNGRSDDQLRRNHSVQYISMPQYPWHLLRKDFPGQYEAYADIVPDEWIHLKIKVHEQKAWLFINGADQPCLIVNDLKQTISSGSLALWVGPGTEGYFSNLKVNSMTSDR